MVLTNPKWPTLGCREASFSKCNINGNLIFYEHIVWFCDCNDAGQKYTLHNLLYTMCVLFIRYGIISSNAKSYISRHRIFIFDYP